MRQPVFSPIKHPFYKVVQPSESVLVTGRKIVGWWIYHPPEDCCTEPDPVHMSPCGWFAVACTFILFWPAMFIPCFFSVYYEGYQTPVFATTSSPPVVVNATVNDDTPIVGPVVTAQPVAVKPSAPPPPPYPLQ